MTRQILLSKHEKNDSHFALLLFLFANSSMKKHHTTYLLLICPHCLTRMASGPAILAFVIQKIYIFDIYFATDASENFKDKQNLMKSEKAGKENIL